MRIQEVSDHVNDCVPFKLASRLISTIEHFVILDSAGEVWSPIENLPAGNIGDKDVKED